MKPIRPRCPSITRGWVAGGAIMGFAVLTGARAAGAQASAQNGVAPQWAPPYCSQQPMISAVFDHQLPRYARDSVIRLYSGADIAACADADGARPGYDGHSGWDFTRQAYRQGCGVGLRPGQVGDLVFAAADGLVAESRWDRREHDGRNAGYGLMLALAHGADEMSLYGHLAALFVQEGETVQAGRLVGALGTTGNANGPHLHFQAARGKDATSSSETFDPFGWSRLYGPGQLDPPFEDPHRGPGWSRRALYPGQPGPPCPAPCGSWVVDQEDPSVRWGCAGAGADCGPWQAQPGGWQGLHRWTAAMAGAEGRWVRFGCAACPPGPYLVEAYVPAGARAASTHVARYQVGGNLSVMDQHAEGDLWHPLGIFEFRGAPWVALSDRGDLQDYQPPNGKRVAADAVRFSRICGGAPAGTPIVDLPRDAIGGGR
ncbi:MAG: peptidoglycan DD-metalloendopeptidase family protein [Ardenticatenia bacterium]|nr:peptidoglycan DD-metalloendopeptidase family protein [Ardenticatenia bacterium]